MEQSVDRTSDAVPPGGGPSVLGVVAPSGTGKTTFLCRLLPLLKGRGLRVGAVKHTHHGFEIDRPGKDSYLLREAGADQTLLVGPTGWALMARSDPADEDTLATALSHLESGRLDVVLVEGYRGSRYPKLELYRQAVGEAPLYPMDPTVIAVISSDPLPRPTDRPVFPLDEPERVVRFLLDFLGS